MATEFADMAQEVEHVLGKDEVTSSNLVISSKKNRRTRGGFVFLFIYFSLFLLFYLRSRSYPKNSQSIKRRPYGASVFILYYVYVALTIRLKKLTNCDSVVAVVTYRNIRTRVTTLFQQLRYVHRDIKIRTARLVMQDFDIFKSNSPA